jgi:hypothetical protein
MQASLEQQQREIEQLQGNNNHVPRSESGDGQHGDADLPQALRAERQERIRQQEAKLQLQVRAPAPRTCWPCLIAICIASNASVPVQSATHGWPTVLAVLHRSCCCPTQPEDLK